MDDDPEDPGELGIERIWRNADAATGATGATVLEAPRFRRADHLGKHKTLFVAVHAKVVPFALVKIELPTQRPDGWSRDDDYRPSPGWPEEGPLAADNRSSAAPSSVGVDDARIKREPSIDLGEGSPRAVPDIRSESTEAKPKDEAARGIDESWKSLPLVDGLRNPGLSEDDAASRRLPKRKQDEMGGDVDESVDPGNAIDAEGKALKRQRAASDSESTLVRQEETY